MKELRDKQHELEKMKVNLTIEAGKIVYLEERVMENRKKIDHLEKMNLKNEEKIESLNSTSLELGKEIKKLEGKLEPKPEPEGATLPSSCTDLQKRGQPYNGVFLVKNSSTKKIVAVSCEFGTSGKVL